MGIIAIRTTFEITLVYLRYCREASPDWKDAEKARLRTASLLGKAPPNGKERLAALRKLAQREAQGCTRAIAESVGSHILDQKRAFRGP